MKYQHASPLERLPFRFDWLPEQIRTKVYNHLIPDCFIFKGSRNSDAHEWPKNPITDLVASNSDLHALSSEVDKQLYSRSRFEFHNIRGCGETQVRGYETAKEFFDCIGPIKLSYITQINCEFTWLLRKGSTTKFSQMLSSLAGSDPPRKLKNLNLEFEEVLDIVLAGQKIQMQSFALRGLIGLELNIVLETKTRLSANQMNDWMPWHDEMKRQLSRVDYLTRLPRELRFMIYRHLIPKRSLIGPTLRKIGSRPSSDPGILGVLRSNSQPYSDICTLMYGECKFELRATSLWDHLPQVDWVTSFLQNTGMNALHIRHVEIVLNIYGFNSSHYTPSIAPMFTALNQHCSFQFAMPIQLVDFHMSFNRDINKVCARWKVVTRASTELIVEVQVRKPGAWPVALTDDCLARMVYKVVVASLGGFQSRVDSGGEVELQ